MKKIILKIFLLAIILFSSVFVSYAKNYTDADIDKIYSNFTLKLEKKYNNNIELIILKKLQLKLDFILLHKKLSFSLKKIIIRLWNLNKNFINRLSYKNNFQLKQNITQLKENKADTLSNYRYLSNYNDNDFKINYKNQLKTEWLIRNFLKKKQQNFIISDYIKNLISKWKKFYLLSSKYEFVENNNIYRFAFLKYYKINSSNYKEFYNKIGVIIYNANLWYIFIEDFKTEKKIPYSESEKYTIWVLNDKKLFLLGNDWYYYFYRFTNYSHISDIYWFYISDLKKLWLNNKNLLIYVDKNHKFNFVSNYKKIRLVNKNFLVSIWNKDLFLKILSNDYRFLDKDYTNTLLKIKEVTNRLTNWVKDNNKKVKLIYSWILNNISYTRSFKLNDYRIFSGVETFNNKNGVCEWYVKLMWYMLLFSWINNFEDIRWYVIDAPDFPNIWHAWLRIWDKYYDPTFDDPIWASSTKTYDKYKYFALPKDLFYANRYDYWKLPEYVKKLSLTERKKLIFEKLKKLVYKYKNSNYLIIKPLVFRLKYNLLNKQKLDISDFKKILKYYIVNDYKFYDKNNIKRNISHIVYYVINNDNIEQIIEDYFNYNLNNVYLFKWNLWNWKYEYRITNNVIIK